MGAQRSPLLRRSERETPRSRRTLRAISRSLAAPPKAPHRPHRHPLRRQRRLRRTRNPRVMNAITQQQERAVHDLASELAIHCLIHPNAVATAWYAGLTNRPTTTLGCRARLQWRLSLALRGVAHPG